MSAPDRIASTMHTATHHYFADIEVHVGASLTQWDNMTLAYAVDDENGFDASAVLTQLRAKAAARHGVEPCDVRVRTICRL